MHRPILLAVVSLATLLPGAQAADAPPAVEFAGPAPALWATTFEPGAWVVFRVPERFGPGVFRVRIDGHMAPSRQARGPATCVRAAVGSAAGFVKPGALVTVTFAPRDGGETVTRQLRARPYSIDAARQVPDCTTGDRDRFTARAAFSVGLRAFARHSGGGEVSSDIVCRPNPHVGATRRCTGTFRLQAKRSDVARRYRLTAKAATFRNTPDSLQYILHAKAIGPGPGLPARADLTGFAMPQDT